MTLTRESKMTGIKPGPVPLCSPQIPNGLVCYGTEASVLSFSTYEYCSIQRCLWAKYKHDSWNIHHIGQILPCVPFSWSRHQTYLGMNSFRTSQNLTRELKWHLIRVFQHVFQVRSREWMLAWSHKASNIMVTTLGEKTFYRFKG